MQLVELKQKEIYCDSSLVARKFGMKHNKVVRTIETVLPNLEDFRGTGCTPKIVKELRNYRGRNYEAYLLNKDAFIVIMMRFDTKRARQWQGQFIAAFNTMEDHIIKSELHKKDSQWLGQRVQGKLARREETDVIKEFVDYATEQGSKSAVYYYKHITNATYKALGLMVQRKPKLRDVMDLYEISELLLAERLAKNSLKKYMDMGRNYKDIYESVKDDLEMFGSNLRLN